MMTQHPSNYDSDSLSYMVFIDRFFCVSWENPLEK